MRKARYCPVCEKVWDKSHGDLCPVCMIFIPRIYDHGKGFIIYKTPDLPLSDLEVDPR